MNGDKKLVILFHGVGSDGANLASLGQMWQANLPALAYEAPDGPEPCGMGFQWFDLHGVTAANRPARIEAARPAFDAKVTAILAAHGLTDRLDRVAFAGFSQGSMMALDAVASGRWPVAGLVAYSGRLASPTPLTPSKATRVLLLHGEADAVVPAEESVLAEQTLSTAGLTVQSRVFPALGHSINREGALMGAHFLRALF